MKNFYRVMLGRRGAASPDCLRGGYIGIDFGVAEDLSQRLADDRREFNRAYVPVFMAEREGASKASASAADQSSRSFSSIMACRWEKNRDKRGWV